MKKETIEKISAEIEKEARYDKETLAVYGLIDFRDGWGNLNQFGIDRTPKNKKDKFNVSKQIVKDVGISGAMKSMY